MSLKKAGSLSEPTKQMDHDNSSNKLSENKTPEEVAAEAKRKRYKANIFYVDNFDLDHEGHPHKWKIYYAKAMVVWALLSQIFLLLQVIKIYTEKNAQGVSLPAYIVYIIGNIVWFVYGTWVLAYRNMPIIVSSVVAFALASIIIVGIILYG